eukprot:TRINITY_DN4833_c0_g1_i5.p1 TRINITY_DN4833_c0_g1~~TRINITY_DN4833_c0_g1_i5.p1  ORF type:complete len:231 (+),score=37.19 TRINITY_DN4833_c0_g1_i5:30-695(+)
MTLDDIIKSKKKQRPAKKNPAAAAKGGATAMVDNDRAAQRQKAVIDRSKGNRQNQLNAIRGVKSVPAQPGRKQKTIAKTAAAAAALRKAPSAAALVAARARARMSDAFFFHRRFLDTDLPSSAAQVLLRRWWLPASVCPSPITSQRQPLVCRCEEPHVEHVERLLVLRSTIPCSLLRPCASLVFRPSSDLVLVEGQVATAPSDGAAVVPRSLRHSRCASSW